MIKDGEPMFIDFQGGRKGPFFYDVASFLWQAKANFPNSLRQELLKEYEYNLTWMRQIVPSNRDELTSMSEQLRIDYENRKTQSAPEDTTQIPVEQ